MGSNQLTSHSERSMTKENTFRYNLDIFGVPRNDPGWIYIVKNGELLKVGRTKNPKRRIFGEARTWLPNIEIIGIKPFWNVRVLERRLHEGLAQYWHAGEWFNFPDQLDYDLVTEGFCEFYDNDRDSNSVDFVYWFNSSGLAEVAVERHRQKLSLRKWKLLASSE